MTLTELRYIIALDKERHFGRAAERSFVSQPTLSVALRKFEDQLGVTVFERQPFASARTRRCARCVRASAAPLCRPAPTGTAGPHRQAFASSAISSARVSTSCSTPHSGKAMARAVSWTRIPAR